MRCLAIADIHGCSQALDSLWETVEPQADDLIITLGDYINKGPDSRGVMDRLIEIWKTHKLIPLKGNHDLLFIKSRFHSLKYSLEHQLIDQQTLLSYAHQGQKLDLANIPESHWSFISETCLDSWENKTHIFVHANLDPQLPLDVYGGQVWQANQKGQIKIANIEDFRAI